MGAAYSLLRQPPIRGAGKPPASGVTYLLDTSVLIDALNNRNGRPQFLTEFSRQEILLACCAVNVTEVYMGMRPSEETKTVKLLRSLEFYPVTWGVAQLAGDLFRDWLQKGQTLSYADVTIAAVAIFHKLVLVTDNQKHFPMPELQLVDLPDLPTSI
jgi:predicted nucleic acid-binding protein